MKILHTADLHLQCNNSERWEALKQLLTLARRESVDLFVISGDLFDSVSDAEKLYPKLRPLFTGNDFFILICPGNHDRRVFHEGYYLGEDVRLMISSDHPLIFQNEQLAIWSLPYEQMSEVQVLSKIQELSNCSKENMYNVLLFHGELLETFYSGADFGEESGRAYMPVKKSNLTSTSFDYILAGHFHTNYRVFQLGNLSAVGGYFIYPGSPISITTREEGERKANLVELGYPPVQIPLQTKHYVKQKLELDPLHTEPPINQLEIFLRDLELDAEAEVLLHVSGYVSSDQLEVSEQELVKLMEKVCERELLKNNRAVHYTLYPEFKDLGLVLDDDLFKQMKQKITETNEPEDMQRLMLKMVIESMAEVKS